MTKILDYQVKTKADLKKFLTQEIKHLPQAQAEPTVARRVVKYTVDQMKTEAEVESFMRGYMCKPKIVEKLGK